MTTNPPPPAAPTPTHTVGDDEIRAGLDGTVLVMLRPVALGLTIYYALLAVAHQLTAPPLVATVMSPLAAASAIGMMAAFAALGRWPLPARHANAAATAILAVGFVNSLVHQWLLGDPKQTTNLMLVALGAGLFVLSYGWLFLVLGLTIGGWALVLRSSPPSPDWQHFGFALFSTSLVSVLALVTRLRSYRRLEWFRLLDERRHQELEAAVHASRQNEARFRHLASATLEGVALLDGERILDANQRMADIFRYDAADLPGTSVLSLAVPESRGTMRQRLPSNRPFEVMGLRKDGSRVPLEVCATSADGAAERPMIAVRDLTERKRTEEAQVRAQVAEAARRAMEESLAERRRAEQEERRLKEQLLQSQKMEGIGRLAGGVAHDFNNLLTAILGYADIIMESTPEGDEAREHAAEIAKAGTRAADLVRHLLAFARKQMLDPMVVDLNELILTTDKMLRRLIGEDIELVILPAPGIDPVQVDPGQVSQLLVNLAVNARDAMPTGGRLTIETRNVVLTDDDRRRDADVVPGPHVLLSVRDTGTGMTPETLSHVFEPFFTTKPAGLGTGLGLATCYGIIKQLRGHIWVTSTPGHGATFDIYLPRADQAVTVPLARAAAEHGVEGTETVLLVEDEPLVRTLAARALEAHGYTVLVAPTGADALRMAREHEGPIHLLLTDVVMPQMSGTEVAERLAPLRPDVRVLYMSGYAESVTAGPRMLPGRAEFLPKPFMPARLVRKVRDLLDAESV
jgi:PAS domain S-box-containing protein